MMKIDDKLKRKLLIVQGCTLFFFVGFLSIFYMLGGGSQANYSVEEVALTTSNNATNSVSSAGRRLFRLKTYRKGLTGSNWDNTYKSYPTEFCTREFTLYKTLMASTFTLPKFWILNSLEDKLNFPNVNSTSDNYILNYGDNAYNIYKDSDTSYKLYKLKIDDNTRFNALPECVIKPFRPYTGTIQDNKNNSFTISASGGQDGINNGIITNRILSHYYSYQLNYFDPSSGTYPEITSVNNTTIDKHTLSLNFSDTGAEVPSWVDEITVTAQINTEGEYGYYYDPNNSSNGTALGGTLYVYRCPTVNIKRYVEPGPISNIAVEFSKGRPVARGTWTVTWSPAEPRNDSSENIKYKVKILKCDESGIYETFRSCEYDTSKTSLTIEESDIKDLAAGSKIRIVVTPYTVMGNGSILCDGEMSNFYEMTLENLGVIRVRVNNDWKEGLVRVYVNNDWVEAETVQVKTANGWKESI